MNKAKTQIYSAKFAGNFSPNRWEKLIQAWETSRTEVIIDLLPTRIGKLADIACGSGKLLTKVSSRCEFIYGFDISPLRLRQAKKELKKVGHKIKLQAVDLDKKIPLTNKKLDVIVCEASLNCFFRPDFVLAECYRTLKPHGLLVIQVPNYAFLPRRLSLLLGKMPKVSSFTGFGDGGMWHNFTYSSLKALLQQTGFIIKKTSNSGVWAGLRKIRPSLLAGDIIYLAQKE